MIRKEPIVVNDGLKMDDLIAITGREGLSVEVW